MALERVFELTGDRVVRIVTTDASDGDLAVSSPSVDRRRRRIVDRPWSWLHQVHGTRVVTVRSAGEHAGTSADAAVTGVSRSPLAVHTADCAPVVMFSPQGVIGAAHAGWRGLRDGVLEATARKMRSLGARRISAFLGPCIGPECYEFGAGDLASVVSGLGSGVGARTAAGAPALDMRAAVRSSLERAEVALVETVPRCTACGSGLFSHRARADTARHATVAWIDAP